MSNPSLGEALYQALSGVPSELDDYSPDWLPVLRAEAGTLTALAGALGVSRTTVQGWFGVRGGGRVSQPSERAQALMQILMRQIRGRERQAAARAAKKITVKGTDRYEAGRYREIGLREGGMPAGLRAGTMAAIVDGYIRDGADGAEAAFHAGVYDRGNHYPAYFDSADPDFGIDVEGVQFG